MKQSQIKELSVAELQDKINSEKANYNKLKMNHAVSPLENPLQLKSLRKTVARLKTELGKRNSNGNK